MMRKELEAARGVCNKGPNLVNIAERMNDSIRRMQQGCSGSFISGKTTDDVYYIPMHQPLPWKQAILTACQGSCYRELLQPEEISAKQSVPAYCVVEWFPCPRFFLLEMQRQPA